MFNTHKNVHHNATLGDDILRYKKNKLAGNLALLGIVFNCLYFMLLYSVNDPFLYKLLVGISIICTLAVLLAGFYASEAIKGYDKKFSIVLIVLAVVQIIRIFILPLQGLNQSALNTHYFGAELGSGATFAWLLIWLVLSAACFAGSAYGAILLLPNLKST